jgi:hypothetical protein
MESSDEGVTTVSINPETTASSEAGAGSDTASTLQRLAPRMIGGLVLAIVVLSALALFADVRQLRDAFGRFDWWLAVPVLALTLGNYALRIVKWEIYLRRIGVPRLPLTTSALVFLAAFSMSITPGKVGEVITHHHLDRLRHLRARLGDRAVRGCRLLCFGGAGFSPDLLTGDLPADVVLVDLERLYRGE